MSYIIPMEKPKRCGLCPCFHAEHPMHCQAVKAHKDKRIIAPYGAPIPDWCPLIECRERTEVSEGESNKGRRDMIQKGIYRHFKGGIYEVIGVAIHTETQDALVIYRDYENPNSITWARPVSMWNEKINGKPRFERIEGSEE